MYDRLGHHVPLMGGSSGHQGIVEMTVQQSGPGTGGLALDQYWPCPTQALGSPLHCSKRPGDVEQVGGVHVQAHSNTY